MDKDSPRTLVQTALCTNNYVFKFPSSALADWFGQCLAVFMEASMWFPGKHKSIFLENIKVFA